MQEMKKKRNVLVSDRESVCARRKLSRQQDIRVCIKSGKHLPKVRMYIK